MSTEPKKDWYIEARVGSGNFRGDCVRYIRDGRGTDGGYENEPAEEMLARVMRERDEAQAEVKRLQIRIGELESELGDPKHRMFIALGALGALGQLCSSARIAEFERLRSVLLQREMLLAECRKLLDYCDDYGWIPRGDLEPLLEKLRAALGQQE